ncbi:exo-alpha-sialidase [Candidatus Sumerlaeota bacterium]|nr:exo-alpha-sialidase [Candidatus Sumerlaeota bacterium]
MTTDGNGVWLSAWTSYDNIYGNGTDGDLFISRSMDDGNSWTTPTLLNSRGTIDSGVDDQVRLCPDGNGNWVAVWYSPDTLGGTKGTDYDVIVSCSSDNGLTWSPETLLNSNGLTDIESALDGRPEVATDGKGNWVCVWMSYDDLQGQIGNDIDVLVSRSTDNGQTWTPATWLNTTAPTDSGADWCPQIITDRKGKWACVWASNSNIGGSGSDFDILISWSLDNGAAWSPPQPVNANAATDSGDDFFTGLILSGWGPRIETDELGHWIVVWNSRETLGGTIGPDSDLLYARSIDDGATWSYPKPLNSNAGSDYVSGDFRADTGPKIATDKKGNWVTVWESQAWAIPPVYDHDIAVSRSTDNGLTRRRSLPTAAAIG